MYFRLKTEFAISQNMVRADVFSGLFCGFQRCGFAACIFGGGSAAPKARWVRTSSSILHNLEILFFLLVRSL